MQKKTRHPSYSATASAQCRTRLDVSFNSEEEALGQAPEATPTGGPRSPPRRALHRPSNAEAGEEGGALSNVAGGGGGAPPASPLASLAARQDPHIEAAAVALPHRPEPDRRHGMEVSCADYKAWREHGGVGVGIDTGGPLCGGQQVLQQIAWAKLSCLCGAKVY